MKIKQLPKIQNLQDAFSGLCGLTMIMSDPDGKRVTELSGVMDLVQLLLKVQRLSENDLIVLLKKIHPIEHPIVYETKNGFKLVAAPIRIRGQAIYYIIAGIMVEEGSKGLIAHHLLIDLPDERDLWEHALHVVPSCNQESIKLILQQLKQLVEIIQILLAEDMDKGDNASRLQLLNLLSLMDRSDPDWMQGVLKVFVRVMGLEFAGLALKMQGEQYTVTETCGLHEKVPLKGASFYTGEGFLGQVSLTKQMGYWENPDRDPRGSFFTGKGILTKNLICYPVKNKDKLYGVLFGGHSSIYEISEELADMGALLVHHLASDFQNLESEEEVEQLNLRMKSLQETIHGVMDVKESESFFHMAIDWLQSSLRAPFIGLVIHEHGKGQLKSYCSGNMAEELSTAYVEYSSSKYFDKDSINFNFNIYRKTRESDWNGLKLIELPLFIGNRLLGVMGVHLNRDNKQKETTSFLSAISKLITNKLVLDEKTAAKEVEAAVLLQQTLEVLKPEAYIKAMNASELARMLLKEMDGLSENIELIGQACLLSEFEQDLLLSWIGETPALNLLTEARLYMLQGSSNKDIGIDSYSLAIKALSIVLWYGMHVEQEVDEFLSQLPFPIEEAFKQLL
jgi:ligand-binding sensor protein